MEMAVKQNGIRRGFSPNLGWSHYRALMNVEHQNERLFYEIEAEGWEVKHLERQIHTFLFARLLKSRDKGTVLELACQGQRINTPADTIKDPYILDFLGLPDSEVHHESEIEKAIIDNLQSFLLELGKGFAFVGRQKRLQFDDDYFYIDLVL
jgi:predicted nuclease of restriction endonuclease-like (RecB) superfamily